MTTSTHLVLSLNPSAQFDWDKCSLRNPLTHTTPDLADLVANTIDANPGQYLVEVEVTVRVLASVEDSEPVTVSTPTLSIAA
jgi:hypothetical protein